GLGDARFRYLPPSIDLLAPGVERGHCLLVFSAAVTLGFLLCGQLLGASPKLFLQSCQCLLSLGQRCFALSHSVALGGHTILQSGQLGSPCLDDGNAFLCFVCSGSNLILALPHARFLLGCRFLRLTQSSYGRFHQGLSLTVLHALARAQLFFVVQV